MTNYSAFQNLYAIDSGRAVANGLLITPDQKHLISAGGRFCLWQLQTGQHLKTLEEEPWWPMGAILSPDGRTLYGFGRSEIYIWDYPSLQLRQKTGENPDAAHVLQMLQRDIELDIDDMGRDEGQISSMVMDVRQQKLYVARSRGDKYHWDIATETWMHPGTECSELAISRDSNILVGTHADWLEVSQLSGNKPLFREEIYGGYIDDATQHNQYQLEPGVSTLAANHDGTVAYMGYTDGVIELWRTDRLESLGLWQGHESYIETLSLNPDGTILASASEDGLIKLWDTATGSVLLTLHAHEKWIPALTFSPDGKLLASSGGDCTIKLWGEPGALD